MIILDRKHISQICRMCYRHIRDLRRIRRYLPFSVAKTITTALVTNVIPFFVILPLTISQNYNVFKIV